MDPMAKEKIEHFLSLKVMCLTRPSFISPIIVTNDDRDMPCDLFNNILRKDITTVPGTETIGASSFLLLPQCFAEKYLGETFSCYICVHNHVDHKVKDVVLKVTLVNPESKEIVLTNATSTSTDLDAGENVDQVIHYEVKDIGIYILICEVSYCSASISSEILNFKKVFKFKVNKPLDMITKIYAVEPDEVYLEAQVQNITSGYLVLENVSLEASPLFKVDKLSTTLPIEGLNLNIMASNESKQFLYCMSLHKSRNKNLKAFTDTNIGKLDIVWRSNLGEKGHLQTHPLCKKKGFELENLHLCIDELPNLVFLEDIFNIKLRLTNISKNSMALILLLEQIGGLAWCATSGVSLGNLPAGESKLITLKIIPLIPGLQTISGIKIKDSLTNGSYDFKEISQVYVIKK